MARRSRLELSPQRKRENLLKEILKNYEQWKVFVEDEGLQVITIHGEEWHFYDILNGIETLPARQREALELMCIQDMREVDAARAMGFKKWSTPVQQYRNLALRKLLYFQDASPEERKKLLAKKRRRRKKSTAREAECQTEEVQAENMTQPNQQSLELSSLPDQE